MKKSIIWLLTAVMSVAFAALLYFQITYLDNMVKMREGQFNEIVMRSLSSTTNYLERRETLHFLEQDANMLDNSLYDELTDESIPSFGENIDKSFQVNNLQQVGLNTNQHNSNPINFQSPTQSVSARYKQLQETIKSQYLYQKGLLNEVILTILRDAGGRPVIERADSALIRDYLSTQLRRNGLDVPFVFAVTSENDKLVYASEGYNLSDEEQTYSQELFPSSDDGYTLSVQFPTKHNYIFSSVRFVIPALALTMILLVIFVFTILLAFRQKKITEMKSDFINNMTHELKTPISTISLAAQMLNDDSVRKSPETLRHLAKVIGDESKRLRFQVEKVLQLSVFDDQMNALKFSYVDVNALIPNVVSNFTIKVEKYGGDIDMHLKADNAQVNVDEMQFTNVIYNLFDNAVKYMHEDREPHLSIYTVNPDSTHVEIRIKDNGIGIKKDDIKRIFDKFYRVNTGNRHDVKGFGLGLAYVKRMVSIFGGKIDVESEYGKGTTFIITLPLSTASG